MKQTYIILLGFLLLFSCIQCSKEETLIGTDPYKKTVVFISDNSPSNDFIIEMIGKIKSLYPDADIQYFQTKPFDIREASYFLDIATGSFPDGTYFVGLLDPGTISKNMVYKKGNSRFLTPDNGLSTRVINSQKINEFYNVDNPVVLNGKTVDQLAYKEYFIESLVSLLSYTELSKFGTKITSPIKFSIQEPVIVGDTIKGEVLYTDNFGNCITNIPESLFSNIKQGDLLKVSSGVEFFLKFGTSYSSVDIGQNVGFINNSHRLEIAVNYDNVSNRYNLASGSTVKIVKGSLSVGFLLFTQTDNTNNIIAGIKSRLAELGLENSKNIIYSEKNAQGDNSVFSGLIADFVKQKINIIVPLGTPPSQAAVKLAPVSIPIVYTYVTSPSSAGLIGARKYVTGVSNATNFDDYLSFVKELFPDLKTAGRIYNNTESNSVYAQDQLLANGPYYNLSYISTTIASENDIPNAFQQLLNQNIKTILISADNTVNKGILKLADLSKQNKFFLLADSRESVSSGALAAISVNYDEMIKSTADYIYSVILGKNPDNISIKTFNNDVISINKTTATIIGYSFSQQVISKAKYIY